MTSNAINASASATTCLQQLDSTNKQMRSVLGTVQSLETKIQECNRQNSKVTQALRDCEAMRAKPCTNTRNLPDGRLTYKGCYAENDTRRALEPEIHVFFPLFFLSVVAMNL